MIHKEFGVPDNLQKKAKGKGEHELNIRFCLPEEVNRKRQQLLVFKGRFLIKMLNMKAAGLR
jgi:hypothetical protein